MKDILESIPEGDSLISEELSEEEKEKRRAKVCELMVHASDISFLARTFENQKTCAYILFEEFFN